MTKWHDYLYFTKAYPFIIGLIFSQTLADNTLVTVLITYLKEEWNQSLRLAAAIVNFREFFTDIIKVYVSHISDEYFGRFPAVLWLTGSYTFGLIILWVLEAHNSNNIKMLYLALFFISLGKAGDFSLKSFICDQLRVNEPSKKVNEDRVEGRTKVWRGFPWILAAGIASFLNASWEAYSILLTTILAVELLGFYLGKPLYAFEFIETESAWKKIYYVGKAAINKRHLRDTKSAGEYYENTKYHSPLMPNIYIFRWLDKAARVDHSTNLSVQEQVDMKMLFTVAEVEEVKYISKIVPSFPTLLIYSIIEAAGTTLFFNQANEIDKDFPVIRFFIIRNITSYCASILWKNRWEKLLKMKILTGMVCSVVCTIIAWRVEVYRKHVLEESHVTISIWWLTPQFIFLGLMEGLLKDGIEGLFKDRVSESMNVSGTNLVQFMIGIGRLVSFLCVLKLGTGINEVNRLGRYYYGCLGVASVVNASVSGPILYNYLKDVPNTTSTSSTPSEPTPSHTSSQGAPPPPPSPPSPPKKLGGHCTPKEETQCNSPPPKGCGGSTYEDYPDYNGPSTGCKCNGDCCPFSDGIRNPPMILDCPPWTQDWNCIPYVEETSSSCPQPQCLCDGDCHNNPPVICSGSNSSPCRCGDTHCHNYPGVICTPWIVIEECTPHIGDNFHNWAL